MPQYGMKMFEAPKLYNEDGTMLTIGEIVDLTADEMEDDPVWENFKKLTAWQRSITVDISVAGFLRFKYLFASRKQRKTALERRKRGINEIQSRRQVLDRDRQSIRVGHRRSEREKDLVSD